MCHFHFFFIQFSKYFNAKADLLGSPVCEFVFEGEIVSPSFVFFLLLLKIILPHWPPDFTKVIRHFSCLLVFWTFVSIIFPWKFDGLHELFIGDVYSVYLCGWRDSIEDSQILSPTQRNLRREFVTEVILPSYVEVSKTTKQFL